MIINTVSLSQNIWRAFIHLFGVEGAVNWIFIVQCFLSDFTDEESDVEIDVKQIQNKTELKNQIQQKQINPQSKIEKETQKEDFDGFIYTKKMFNNKFIRNLRSQKEIIEDIR